MIDDARFDYWSAMVARVDLPTLSERLAELRHRG
jgi:hypothetical protein